MGKVKLTQSAVQRRAFEEAVAEGIRRSGLNEAANERMREIVRAVNRQSKGKPAVLIEAVLRARLIEAGMTPKDDVVEEIARAISDGTLIE